MPSRGDFPIPARPKCPPEVRCRWTERPNERGLFECPDCGMWTANVARYQFDVCPAKDRRKVADRRHHA